MRVILQVVVALMVTAMVSAKRPEAPKLVIESNQYKAPPPPPPSPAVQKLEQEYAALQNATCAKVIPQVPEVPAQDLTDFMNAYQAYNGTGDETAVMKAAEKILSNQDLSKFLSLPDSFVPGGLDSNLVQCAVMFQATPLGLAEFAAVSAENKTIIDTLLSDPLLMRDMLVGGGAKDGNYGRAMAIYQQLIKASNVLDHDRYYQHVRAADSPMPWDDRNQSSVMHRFALGLSLEFAVPVHGRWSPEVDPVARYMHYEEAYLAGDLDPAFEVLTVFECRYVSPCETTNDELAWMRASMGRFRPEHIASDDYHWRYARAVRTDVAYGDSVWPDGRPSFKEIPAAGGVCGPRAWFGRFNRRAFGLPTWGVQQPGHAAMTTWGPTGWRVLLGADWSYSYWENRGGDDFFLETQCREFRPDFQQVLRGQWVADALGEEPVSPNWGPRSPSSYGQGGPWNALMLYAKKVSVEITHNNTIPPRPIGPSIVPTKVDDLIKRWPEQLPTPNITIASNGTITIPAVALAGRNHSAPLTITKGFYSGQQVSHGSGNFLNPDSTAFWYEVTVEKEQTLYLTLNFTTWHMNTDLQLTTNTTTKPVEIPVYYTVGEWNETQAVEVKLIPGKNVLRFVRQRGEAMVFRDFFLYPTKPDIPMPPSNHTPSPAPPPADDYIELPAGKTCTSQGILDLTEPECGIAVAHLGFKYTGARNRPFFSGCFVLEDGPWKGNGNFNSNSSAVCCDPTARAVCLRN